MAIDMVSFLHLCTGHVIVGIFTNSSAVGGKAANGADPANTCGQCHEGFTNGKCRC